jgi:N-hydroxyarylamine O-acetyltransferase
MSDTAIDFEAYARRIGFDGPASPTHATLARLIGRHAAAIPFENIEVLAGRVPQLDAPSLQRKLVQQPRGGYCFEQNTFFLACLQQLGFAARGVEARVRTGVPADVVTPRTHMAIRVTLDGEDWLADVGFGGLAPLAPIRVASRAEQPAGSGTWRFVDMEGGCLLQAKSHDGWTDCYAALDTAPRAIDYEMANWWVATHPKAMLRQNLLVARAVDGGRLTLFNRQLSLRQPASGVPQEQRLATRAELADVLADGFGLRIDAADVDAVMRIVDTKD